MKPCKVHGPGCKRYNCLVGRAVSIPAPWRATVVTRCNWGICDAVATMEVLLVRPCGHVQDVVASCEDCGDDKLQLGQSIRVSECTTCRAESVVYARRFHGWTLELIDAYLEVA